MSLSEFQGVKTEEQATTTFFDKDNEATVAKQQGELLHEVLSEYISRRMVDYNISNVLIS